jgi:uncharacterized membrane protein YGL010W
MISKLTSLLNEYGESHQHPTNKLVHWICVPLIFWSIAGLLYAIPFHAFNDWINVASIALMAVLIYYVRLSLKLAIGMLVFAAICILSWRFLAIMELPIIAIALSVFAGAWIGQFWGHKIEGKKPSFLKDIQFLLIGPAWLMSQIIRRE